MSHKNSLDKMRLCSNMLVVLVLFTLTFVHIDCRRNKSKDVKSKADSKTQEMDTIICPTCDRLFCTVRKPSRLQCAGGKTTDICGCCPVCAKQVGDACGGEWNYLGKCDAGLYCKAPTISLLTPIIFQQQIKQSEVPRGGIAEGTCAKLQDMTPNDVDPGTKRQIITQPKCQPKCSPEFCLKNTRAICSAVDVVDMKRECHGSCQHTSCQACSWVDPEPDCGACLPDDIPCIKRFAKCIKRSTCTRAKFPCKSIADEDHVGKFQCMVPKCLDKS